MSIQLCVLGSGSAGNSSLVRLRGGSLLIDAGFGPRALPARLAQCGACLDEVSAILITHADRDHFTPTWFNTLLSRRIRLYVHQRHQYPLYRAIHTAYPQADPSRLAREGLLHWFDDRPFRLPLPAGPVSAHPLVLPIGLIHDQAGTTGFRIESSGQALGWATDLGRVSPPLIDHLANTHILAIESNYDPAMQLASNRPAALKQRIMNGRGHLSNLQALHAVRQICRRSDAPPHHIVLLHLSRQCNDPRIVQRTFAVEPHISRRLRLTCQHQPTGWLSTAAPVQTVGPSAPHRLFN